MNKVGSPFNRRRNTLQCELCKLTPVAFELLSLLLLMGSGSEKVLQSQAHGAIRVDGLCYRLRLACNSKVCLGFLGKGCAEVKEYLFCLNFFSLIHILPPTFTGENRFLRESTTSFPSFH